MITFADFSKLHHAITLLGMSGVGKTILSKQLRKTANWYHYSADYRIGTRYLAEDIVDNIKFKIMQMKDPFVARLLRSDSIYIHHNISVDNLDPVSTFLGMYGDQNHGGLDKKTFLVRQNLYRDAEIRSMEEVGRFINKSWDIYRCKKFVNDASGSLCEVCDPWDDTDSVLSALQQQSLILYIRSDERSEDELKQRAKTDPKPLFYHPSFIEPVLADRPENGGGVDPLDFARPLFPELLAFRKPRYAAIAERAGFTIDVGDLFMSQSPAHSVPSSNQFLQNIFNAITAEVARTKTARDRFAAYLEICQNRQATREFGTPAH